MAAQTWLVARISNAGRLSLLPPGKQNETYVDERPLARKRGGFLLGKGRSEH